MIPNLLLRGMETALYFSTSGLLDRYSVLAGILQVLLPWIGASLVMFEWIIYCFAFKWSSSIVCIKLLHTCQFDLPDMDGGSCGARCLQPSASWYCVLLVWCVLLLTLPLTLCFFVYYLPAFHCFVLFSSLLNAFRKKCLHMCVNKTGLCVWNPASNQSDSVDIPLMLCLLTSALVFVLLSSFLLSLPPFSLLCSPFTHLFSLHVAIHSLLPHTSLNQSSTFALNYFASFLTFYSSLFSLWSKTNLVLPFWPSSSPKLPLPHGLHLCSTPHHHGNHHPSSNAGRSDFYLRLSSSSSSAPPLPVLCSAVSLSKDGHASKSLYPLRYVQPLLFYLYISLC